VQSALVFEQGTQAAKALIDDGALGRLYHARSAGHRRRGRPYVDGYGAMPFVQKRNAAGGALIDLGVYNLNAILYLLGTRSRSGSSDVRTRRSRSTSGARRRAGSTSRSSRRGSCPSPTG
jgi:predicted dehydrogenase